MISPISRNEILEGLNQEYHCCMFGINKRDYHCNMWKDIYDEVGGIGFLAREQNKIIGQMIYMPKRFARKIAISSSPNNDDIDKTMVLGCLYVLKDYGNKGIGSQMIRMLIDFCQNKSYTKVEAYVDTRPIEQLGPFDLSFYPFRKFGFIVDDTREGWEFCPNTRICSLNIDSATPNIIKKEG